MDEGDAALQANFQGISPKTGFIMRYRRLGRTELLVSEFMLEKPSRTGVRFTGMSNPELAWI